MKSRMMKIAMLMGIMAGSDANGGGDGDDGSW